MTNTDVYERWSERFGENLFKKSHSTTILTEEHTIDYLVNFTIEAIKEDLRLIMFVSKASSLQKGYFIEEKIVNYDLLFSSQLNKNANFLSKMHFGKTDVNKYQRKQGEKRKSFEEISDASKRELLFDSDFERTLYALYLGTIFPENNFRPALIYLPENNNNSTSKKDFLFIYTPKK